MVPDSPFQAGVAQIVRDQCKVERTLAGEGAKLLFATCS
jgi:hypothetical protein